MFKKLLHWITEDRTLAQIFVGELLGQLLLVILVVAAIWIYGLFG